MRQQAVITGPSVTPEESARNYGMPMRRAKELIRMVEESIARKGNSAVERLKGWTAKHDRNGAEGHSDRVKLRARANGKAGAKSRNSSRRKSARAKAKKSH
ncbi:MAG: hypothetical protein WBG02_11105 [Candidatus Acidiferrum sp.]